MNKLLFQFFGGCFHQDWGAEAANSEEVVHGYRSQVTVEEAYRLSDLIERDLLMSKRSDDELGDVLYADLGCHFDPTSTGGTVRGWLEEVVRQLRRPAL